MYDPGVTYRIQFNKDFDLSAFEKVTNYLQQLGVTTVYASPIFTAAPGSTHGYDVTGATEINKEIGTYDQLVDILQRLRENNIGWLQDIVPNHMAYHIENKWLTDVMKNGPASKYSSFFDIDWANPASENKLMLPVLGKSLAAAIKDGDIRVAEKDGTPYISISGTDYPVRSDMRLPQGKNIQQWMEMTNNDPAALQKLVEQQHYAPCEWQETNSHINYRRFFTINGMICLNIQDKVVFDAWHKLIKELVDMKIIQGLRVDHIDGLYDPTQYLCRLRDLAGKDGYVTVEKILEPGEDLPEYWPVQGTTGYDFIALVNNLFTMPGNQTKLSEFYNRLSGTKLRLDSELHDKKSLILSTYMQGELTNLHRLAAELIPTDVTIDEGKLKEVIAAFLVFCPVYRYYSNQWPIDVNEKEALKDTFEKIKHRYSQLLTEINVLENILLNDAYINEEDHDKALHFFMRCMQFTGPLMAKGVEDTLMYTYNRFIAVNEVGDSPALTANTVDEFHKAILYRMQKWPHTMNATATHDTKRGEDARMRLHVLSDITDEWIKAVEQWFSVNEAYKINGSPDRNDEYFIYQALVASYPMPGQDADDFENRFLAYIEKALREAKVHTNWANPKVSYEGAASQFIKKILETDSAFMQGFRQLHKKIADLGIINSLVQLALKCTCPGVPDIYQGCELWDLSMVDPDNRRPVDYTVREQWLSEIKNDTDAELIDRLWDDRYGGKIKLWLLHRLLSIRLAHKELFANGKYEPLPVTGKHKDNVIAYARVHNSNWIIVVLPLHISALVNDRIIDWANTAIELTEGIPGRLTDAFSKKVFYTKEKIMLKDITGNLPMAILQGAAPAEKREAGILLPVFSLQSPFGIGDLGQGARSFADFLSEAGQTYWQILPLNPTDAGSMYSPYSSTSSMACNPLLVSPELLAEEKLADIYGLGKYHIPNNGKVDYAHAEKIKAALLDEAYTNYNKGNYAELRYAFNSFCKTESYWLNDYALYAALKNKYNQQAWFQWPDEYKKRDEWAIAAFEHEQADAIEKIKWVQFIIARQWQQLKQYCNSKGVQLFGDMPFYVSYDSVDVWANPANFSLDENGNATGVAGVPPDYFSENGQLWGVPTFNWERIKADNYEWWIKRLKKNAELFDVLRIDHFRALASYWEVPAGQTTAKTGKWIQGPGIEFFKAIEKGLGKLPFIAEDLGYEMDDVYLLRDESKLPGMKVLQFAWGDNISTNVDIPHNYPVNCIAYTGTHDNNTTRGWYANETSHDDRRRMHEYTGRHIDELNVHKAMAAIIYGSVARIAILPMQDVLGLDERARTNTPGTTSDNWQWRMPGDALECEHADYLRSLATLYNRKG